MPCSFDGDWHHNWLGPVPKAIYLLRWGISLCHSTSPQGGFVIYKRCADVVVVYKPCARLIMLSKTLRPLHPLPDKYYHGILNNLLDNFIAVLLSYLPDMASYWGWYSGSTKGTFTHHGRGYLLHAICSRTVFILLIWVVDWSPQHVELTRWCRFRLCCRPGMHFITWSLHFYKGKI